MSSTLLPPSATVPTFNYFFGDATGNLVLLIMVITVQTRISILCCFSHTLSRKNPRCVNEGLYSDFFLSSSFLCIAAFHSTKTLSALPLSLPPFHSPCLRAVHPTFSCHELKRGLESSDNDKSCVFLGDWQGNSRPCFEG